jgi:hypothetical protein
VDQPALRVPEIESHDAADLTIAALAGIRDTKGRRFFSAESSRLKFSTIVSGRTPSRRRREDAIEIGRRSYCLPSSTLSELRDSGGELCA